MIGDFAFIWCSQLEEVELCEGLLDIGQQAFVYCDSLKHINLPTTIRNIGTWAFSGTKSLLSINLPDGIESIGSNAFRRGGLCTFRTPPLITTIPLGMVQDAESLFSLELSESVTHVNSGAYWSCCSLRNVALPQNTEISDGAFNDCEDLQQLFGSDSTHTIIALKHRFDDLPIHKMIYYQSYEPVTFEQLNNATNMRSGQHRSLRIKLDPTGKQQDCLGMTPLHILACSSVQDLELYKVLIEKYPENLITEDRWGSLPLLYAIWGNAPSEIVQYLVESYLSFFSEYEFNWTMMLGSLVVANTPKEVIQKLVDLQLEFFPEQNIDWGRLIESVVSMDGLIQNETFGYLVQFSLATRIDAIGLKQWRNVIREYISNNARMSNRREFITKVEAKLVDVETEYHNLKEATSMLELALWKHRMNDLGRGKKQRRNMKRAKIEESSIREQCRVSCGADIVIEHMLPYLVCPPASPSFEDDSNSDDSSTSGSDDESESDISHL